MSGRGSGSEPGPGGFQQPLLGEGLAVHIPAALLENLCERRHSKAAKADKGAARESV